MRAGATDKAAAVAKPFTLDFDIENEDYAYYRRLLLFNDVIKPNELVDENKSIGEMTLLEMTKLYGLANWYVYHGDSVKAQTLYKKILNRKSGQDLLMHRQSLMLNRNDTCLVTRSADRHYTRRIFL